MVTLHSRIGKAFGGAHSCRLAACDTRRRTRKTAKSGAQDQGHFINPRQDRRATPVFPKSPSARNTGERRTGNVSDTYVPDGRADDFAGRASPIARGRARDAEGFDETGGGA
jgi:hypothetical protein